MAVDAPIVRFITGTRGKVKLKTELILRFGYGPVVSWVTRLEDGTLRDRRSGHGHIAHAGAFARRRYDDGR